jgi:hypothetical protein
MSEAHKLFVDLSNLQVHYNSTGHENYLVSERAKRTRQADSHHAHNCERLEQRHTVQDPFTANLGTYIQLTEQYAVCTIRTACTVHAQVQKLSIPNCMHGTLPYSLQKLERFFLQYTGML